MEKTIRMEKDGKNADVHPDETSNYRKGGWVEVMPVAAKKAKAKPAPTPKDEAE